MKGSRKQPVVPQEIEALRASLDVRLSALEAALSDPRQHGSLESLILDLARLATEEADATARQAVHTAQQQVEDAVAAARIDAEAALDAERAITAELRHVIEQAKAGLKQAEAALKEERRGVEAANRDAATARRELMAVRESLAQEQAAGARARGEIDAAVAAAEAERARAASLEQAAADARSELEAERRVSEARLRELHTAREAMAAELDEQRRAIEGERGAAAQVLQTSADLEGSLAAAREERDVMRAAREAIHGELEGARAEIDALRGDLDATRRELDAARHAAAARAQSLSDSHSEQGRALSAALDAAQAAEARAAEAARERDRLAEQLESAEAAIAERDRLRAELQAAHDQRDAAGAISLSVMEESETIIDLTDQSKDDRQEMFENRIRSLELALRDAETRAESAELELDLQRRGEPSGLSVEVPLPALSEEPSEPSAAEAPFRGPARAAKRVRISGEVDIQIDGTPGKLVDLSLTGAQLVTPSAMKPNRLVKVTLPMGDSLIQCKAKVAWSRLEPRAGAFWYRAGVSFTSADQIALETFIRLHQK